MKTFVAAFLVISACVAGTLAGTPGTCSAVVGEVKDLSPWVQDAINAQLVKYKGAPMADLEAAMNEFVSGLLSSDRLTQRDIDILNAILGAAISGKGEILIEGSNAIMCYHCNSAYDPRCADPFNSFSLGIINCSMAQVPDHVQYMGIERATLCRKTTQKVYGKVRVVRGCGYITDQNDDLKCVKRSGTHDVHALYCACTTDLCNSSEKVFSKQQIVFGILAAILGSYANQFIQRQL